jgi:hypothetical protein
MDYPLGVSIACWITGAILMLRVPHLIRTRGTGRFRGEPFVCLVVGFALILLAPYVSSR